MKTILARAAERFVEYEGRCIYVGPVDELRPLCVPHVTYELEDLDTTDTALACPECIAIARQIAAFQYETTADDEGIPAQDETNEPTEDELALNGRIA